MTKILIIEDSAVWQANYRTGLPATVEIIEARTFEEGRTAIAQLATNPTAFDIMIVDGCLYSDNFDTPPLVEQALSLGFKGPIVAGSSNPTLNEMLMQRGCTHNAKIKESVLRFLRTNFNIQ
jgi:hypothetical protein